MTQPHHNIRIYKKIIFCLLTQCKTFLKKSLFFQICWENSLSNWYSFWVWYHTFLGRSSYFLGLPYFVSEACLATYKQSDWLSQFFPSLWNTATSNLIGSHSFSQIAGMGKAALQASGHRQISAVKYLSLILEKKIWTNFWYTFVNDRTRTGHRPLSSRPLYLLSYEGMLKIWLWLILY